ncbi:unnamed protein product [Cercopithifilaria johnstoni]|uniref:Uncharacterized protein n=1 Tax=Cercopithifilaria johnstoni TaxID=2874296 RepID=A0A8J2Q896_9BILA|nr:unnamed protein product [Cercopithifilaria johnstoni]
MTESYPFHTPIREGIVRQCRPLLIAMLMYMYPYRVGEVGGKECLHGAAPKNSYTNRDDICAVLVRNIL